MALVAVFCLSAITASGALAGTKKGEIVNKSGNAPVKSKFTGSSTATGSLETAGGSKVECTGSTAVSGQIQSKTMGTATFKFTACESGGNKCKTSGAATGEIVVSPEVLVQIVKLQVYVLTIVPLFDIKCSTTDVKVKGGVLVGITPEETLTTKGEFAAKGKLGKQEPENSEGKGENTEHLQAEFPGKAFENASLNAPELTVTFEEEVEAI